MPDLTPLSPRALRSGTDDELAWEQAMDWLLRLNAPDADELQAELEAWLAASERHARAFRKARKVWQLSGELDFDRTSARTQAPARSRWWKALAGSAIAASLALFALPDWTAVRADHASAADEHRRIELPDGSHIQLDSNSAIDVQFSAGERRVILLRGQAFFEISTDAQRPFRVAADRLEVTVTGTAFNVGLAAEEISVAVEHGSVDVRDRLGSAGEQSKLHAGDRLRLALAGGDIRLDRLQNEQIAAWRDWQLLVEDRPLAEVVEELRRYQPGLILLSDPQLGERRLTAALNLRTPRAALQAAVEPLGGRLESWAPYVLVISPR